MQYFFNMFDFYQTRWFNPVHGQRSSPILLGFATGGLEIPYTLDLYHKENKAAKAERLLKSALGIKSKKVPKEIKENDLKVSVDVTALATNFRKAVPALHLKKLSAGDVFNLIIEITTYKKSKLNYERIIMGEELTDMEINHAQQLLKAKHPKFNGFQSTLATKKVRQFENNIFK